MSVLKQFASRVDVYCCDEAFLDLAGIENLDAYTRMIRETILQYCGIPVSISIARTKTLAKLANRIAKKFPKVMTGGLNLREGLACSSVVVSLETNRFIEEPRYNPSVKIQLPYATDYTTKIMQAAIAGLDQMFEEGYRYNKGGVMVDNLVPLAERQVSLLDPYDREKVASLMQAFDSVNTTFSPGTL